MATDAKEPTATHWLNVARGGSKSGHSLESRLDQIALDAQKLIANKMELEELIARIRRVFAALDKTPKSQIPDNNQDDLAELVKDFVDRICSLRKFTESFGQFHFQFRLARNQALLERIEQTHSDLDVFIDGVVQILQSRQDQSNIESLLASLRALSHQEPRVVVNAADDVTRVKKELQRTAGQEIVSEALCALRFEVPRLARLSISNPLVEALNEHLEHAARANPATRDEMPRYIPADEITLTGKSIGEGGCGEVFRAKLRSTITVVMKRVITKPTVCRCKEDANTCGCANHTNARELLQIRKDAQVREMKIWCQLHHPHILRLYGATSYGPSGGIVSEFACNGSLNVFVKHPKHKPRLWQLLYEAALGIHYMHWKGFVHGDLACDNIFIGGDWKAKIADFGLSFPVGAKYKSVPQSEKTGVFAPELFTATPSQSLPADVFAFGMCIVEAYTGGPPWGLLQSRVVQRYLMRGRLPDVFERLTPAVQELVTKMCAIDPAARPTIANVVVELKKLVDDPPPPFVLPEEYAELLD